MLVRYYDNSRIFDQTEKGNIFKNKRHYFLYNHFLYLRRKKLPLHNIRNIGYHLLTYEGPFSYVSMITPKIGNTDYDNV
jgi:hypothetical protein